MTEVPENIVIGACNLLDAIKSEWGDQWSEWDQSIRDGLSKAFAAAPPASPAPVDEGRVERIVKAFEGVLLDINFAIEQGILPNIMNDMIYVEARAALAAIKGVE